MGHPLAAVLWDMDGTIIDTEEYWIAAEMELVRQHGGLWSREDGLSVVGMAIPNAARELQRRGGVDSSIADIAEELVRLVAIEIRSNGVTWQPGARELLAELAAAGVPCALVTMSFQVLAHELLSQLPAGTFSAVVTGDMVTQGKPHPEPYLKAAELLQVPVDRCLAIEDSPNGLKSAEAAGAKVLGVPHLVEIPAAPGRSRVRRLDQISLADLNRIAAGEAIDLYD